MPPSPPPDGTSADEEEALLEQNIRDIDAKLRNPEGLLRAPGQAVPRRRVMGGPGQVPTRGGAAAGGGDGYALRSRPQALSGPGQGRGPAVPRHSAGPRGAGVPDRPYASRGYSSGPWASGRAPERGTERERRQAPGSAPGVGRGAPGMNSTSASGPGRSQGRSPAERRQGRAPAGLAGTAGAGSPGAYAPAPPAAIPAVPPEFAELEELAGSPILPPHFADLTCRNLAQINVTDLLERLRIVEESVDALNRALSQQGGVLLGRDQTELQAPVIALQHVIESLDEQARRVARASAHNRDNILAIVRAVGLRSDRVASIAAETAARERELREELEKLGEVASELSAAEAEERSRRSADREHRAAQDGELDSLRAQILDLLSEKASLEEEVARLGARAEEGAARLEAARAAAYGAYGDGEVESLASRLGELDGLLAAREREAAVRLV